MSTFTIDADNNITAHAGLPTGVDQSHSFTTAKELAALTAEWPVSRLVETWNSFAGVAPFTELKPVKKFTNRSVAVARIWQAITRLLPAAAEPAAPVAPEQPKSKKSPAKAKRPATARPGEDRANKKAEVITMMRRAKGVTLQEIMDHTGWQAHTVRGFISI
jgi:hypothetical protein